MALTGRFDLRKTFMGKIVLQVEEEVKSLWPGSNETKKRWRDATLLDLTTPQMRTLMDARFRPSLLSYAGPADRTTASPHLYAVPQQKTDGGRRDQESDRHLQAL